VGIVGAVRASNSGRPESGGGYYSKDRSYHQHHQRWWTIGHHGTTSRQAVDPEGPELATGEVTPLVTEQESLGKPRSVLRPDTEKARRSVSGGRRVVDGLE
jgi:hypothetical protein